MRLKDLDSEGINAAFVTYLIETNIRFNNIHTYLLQAFCSACEHGQLLYTVNFRGVILTPKSELKF